MRRRILAPPDILRLLAERCRVPQAVMAPLESARGAFLVDDVEVTHPGGRAAGAVVTVNGYALPAGFEGGTCRYRSAVLEAIEAGERRPSALKTPDPPPADGVSEVVIWRVESGDVLPADADRVVPVHGTRVIGAGLVEVDPHCIPECGHGVERSGEADRELRLSRGTRLTPRLLALLLASGRQHVPILAPETVAVGSIGEELVDPLALDSVRGDPVAPGRTEPGLPGTRAVPDVTGAWLEAAVAKLGHPTAPLGLVADEPGEIIATLQRASRLGARRVILGGGLGDGLRDRTREALEGAPFHIHFSGAALRPGERILFAHGLGIELLVIGGKPLDAAVAFDCFVAPLLLLARGAPPATWNWTTWRRPEGAPPGASHGRRDLWTALPWIGEVGLELEGDPRTASSWALAPHGEDCFDDASDPRQPPQAGLPASCSDFLPALPGQLGWCILPPPERHDRGYFVPCHG